MNKKNIHKLALILFVLISFNANAVEKGTLEPLQKSEIQSKLIQVEKTGTAGIYPENQQHVQVKRVNPKPSKKAPDWEHIAKKDSISMEIANRNSRRDDNILADSLTVALGYDANPFAGSTPMDNHIAVSNDGIVISVINSNVMITDSLGNNLLFRTMNSAFFGDASLTGMIYDPRVFYDPDNNRFILVVLHGSTSATSKVLVCFSKSNRPDKDGWNYYKFSGNPFGNGLWFDYPNIGTNKNELFITGNLFTDARNYNNVVIFQIDKHDGYSGSNSLNTRVWGGVSLAAGQIANSDGFLPFTMVPAYNGFANDQNEDMWFVNTNSGSGTKIYVYRITGSIGQNPVIETSSTEIPFYTQENLCSQYSGNPNVGASPVRLISGDCRMKNAYIQDGIIHCVWNARPSRVFFSHIMYARIDTKSKNTLFESFSKNGTDYAFAAVAPFSNNISDPTALIAFTSSSAVKYPDIGVITVGKDMKFSEPVVVKEGESFVSIYTQNNQTRWGDYSGISKKHNADRPEVWISGSYGAFNPGSSVSRYWRNWNAKITSIDSKEKNFGKTVLYPNPVYEPLETVTFNFVAEESGEYSVRVFDVTGKLVKELFKDNLFPGEYRFTFSTTGYAIGTYIVKYYIDGKPMGHEKMVVVKS